VGTTEQGLVSCRLDWQLQTKGSVFEINLATVIGQVSLPIRLSRILLHSMKRMLNHLGQEPIGKSALIKVTGAHRSSTKEASLQITDCLSSRRDIGKGYKNPHRFGIGNRRISELHPKL
jgi:hypothetical protein